MFYPKQGRRPLRVGWCRTPSAAVWAGFHPRPDVMVSHTATRRAHRLRCAAIEIQTPQAFHRFPGDCGGDDDAFASTTSVDIYNKRRPSGAASSLFPSFTSVNNAVKQFAQTPRPQTSDRTYNARGRGGRDASIAMGAPSPYISRFSLGRHSRFFWQGQKKWGGIIALIDKKPKRS